MTNGSFGPNANGVTLDSRLAAPDNWWQYSRADNGLRLTDPIYGTAIHPDVPPQFMLDEPELLGGLEFLRRNGPNLRFTNFYVVHENAADLEVSTAPFESVVSDFPFFAHEAFNHSTYADILLRRDAGKRIRTLHTLGKVSLAEYLSHSEQAWRQDFVFEDQSYQDRVYRAIVLAQNTHSMPIDARIDGTSLERQLVPLVTAWKKAPTRTPEWRAFSATASNRDWLLLSTLGIRLEQRIGPRVRKTTEVSTLMGAGHSDVTRKLNDCLGAAATPMLFGNRIPKHIYTIDAQTRLSRTCVLSDVDAQTLGVSRYGV